MKPFTGSLRPVLSDSSLRQSSRALRTHHFLAQPRAAMDRARPSIVPSVSLLMPALTLPVIEKVIELRAQFGFKMPDAIHIATGMLEHCDMFVTGDVAWSRAGVTVVDPEKVA